VALLGAGSMGTAIVRRIGAGKKYSSGRMFGTLNFTEYCEFSVRSDEKNSYQVTALHLVNLS